MRVASRVLYVQPMNLHLPSPVALALKPLLFLAVCAAALIACGSSNDPSLFGSNPGGPGSNGGGPYGSLGDSGTNCAVGSLDLTGCPCTPGQKNACYSGPASTRNVNPCHDGIQVCQQSAEFAVFGPCTGETLPTPQNTCGGGNPGGNPPPSSQDAGPPTQCSPPQVSNGHARCPDGTILNGNNECCPCQASDCGNNQACCAASVCASDPTCSTCQGQPLDPICGGFVDKDCDNWPEDCDQLCCPCKPQGTCQLCPSGSVPCNGTCVNAATDVNHCGACDYKCNSGQSCVAGQCH